MQKEKVLHLKCLMFNLMAWENNHDSVSEKFMTQIYMEDKIIIR